MDARGQSETIGLVLLLAITVASVGVVVTVAGSALDSAEHSSSVQRAEQSLSLFDARGALVALGQTDGQTVSLSGSAGGSYDVRPDSGHITVIRQDSDGDQVGDPILDTSLGAIVYENGDAEVAYQGGGVWRSQGAGSRMVSPPEFNYQDATLTLPLVRVTGGESSVSGRPTARVTPNDVDVSKFPTETLSNPLSNGTVIVTVQSDYYRGWAAFFEDRSTGNVTVDEANQTVELELIARGTGGGFSLQETPVKLRGLGDDEPIDSLSFTLEPNKESSFNDLDWSLVADDGGSERFEVNVAGANPCKGKESEVTLTYTNGGTTHEWRNDTAFTADGSTYSYSCDGDTPTLHLDLTGPTNVTYQDASSPLSNNSTGYLVNHYLSELGPNVDLETESKGNNNAPGNSESVDLDASTGNVEYSSSSSRVVTFLHVTENAINVTLS
ncbi:DUF7289 family protein [Halobacterium wangiae]|uniref:DUF7289 family protein n=1 Tax=Halobacterium wangiae TaxID=2902623 RepID=UPI001E4737C9|nr:archaellin/type IV pilin N-terminal domain-containing protein [Halobacterium wangiae]